MDELATLNPCKLIEIKQPNWEFRIGRQDHPALTVHFHTKPPNWFHRKMQAWMLGIYWTKLP